MVEAPGAVDWNAQEPKDFAGDTSCFGAAFSYGAGADTRAFFAENSGLGVFEVAFALVIPAHLWNEGFETETHVAVPAGEPNPTPRPSPRPTNLPTNQYGPECLQLVQEEAFCRVLKYDDLKEGFDMGTLFFMMEWAITSWTGPEGCVDKIMNQEWSMFGMANDPTKYRAARDAPSARVEGAASAGTLVRTAGWASTAPAPSTPL